MNIHNDVMPPVLVNPLQMVGIDIEVFGLKKGRLHHPEGEFASLQISIDDDVYIIYDEHKVEEALRRVDRGVWCIQNAMFDLRHLRRWATIEPRPIWDTFIVERDLWGGYYDNFSLADMARRYLDIRVDKDTRSEFKTKRDWTDEMVHYAALDPILNVQVAKSQREQGVPDVYWNIDEPSIWVFLDFEPVKIDVDGWLNMTKDFKRLGQEIEEQLGINVYSKDKVRKFLKDRCGLKLNSTEASILEEYEELYPEVRDILKARTYRTADSRYGASWVKAADADGLVLSAIKVVGALTGRPASSDPNLFNIPSRKIPEFRDYFVSKHEDGLLTVADISQQEPRIMSCESGDRVLQEVFINGQDIHAEVARAAYKDDSIVKGDPRRDAGKVLGLATNYGMSAKSLAKKLRIEEWEADQFLRNYFARFRVTKMWSDNQKRKALEQGYVTTRSGRKCWINPYDSKYERNAINSPIQGGGADILKLWMYEFWKSCRDKGVRFPAVLQVYDEVVIDHRPEETDTYVPMLMDAVQTVTTKLYPEVPFVAEYATGKNWGVKK